MSNKNHLRVAVAQINTTLGAFKENREKIVSEIKRAEQKHCDLIVFPESTIFGYHPFDLLERSSLVDQQLKQLKEIEKSIPKGLAVLLGVITKNPNKKGRPYFNSAVFLEKGKKPKYFHKQLLPTGDVFDEARFIESGDMVNNFVSYKGKRLFITICEDIWAWPFSGKSQYEKNPLLKVPRSKKIDLILNLSASPFYPGKIKTRKYLVAQTAKLFKAPMIYTNLVGAQDEIIFDGQSFALDCNGKEIMQSASFEEDLNVLDLNKAEGGKRSENGSEAEGIRRALVLGIRDFCRKTDQKKVHLGLSGGIDSALVACLAVDALGPQNVYTMALPTEFNSPESLKLAQELAKNLGIEMSQFSIQKIFNTVKEQFDEKFSIRDFRLLHENMQARIRGLILMAYSNFTGSMLLTTSNKSEMAAGYATLYGDMCGGLAPIADLTKQQVQQLCAIYNLEREIIPEKILTRAPSAELKPNQKDQDSLPAYDVLDASVNNLVENCGNIKNKTDQWLLPKIFKTEFKRWQAPPVLKVSKHSFGRGRRYPIAHKTEAN